MAPPAPPEIITADYLAEARAVEQVPPLGPAEIAIAGRSNVGKSTLLNRLAARHSLARTSKTPGRTRGIIFYDLVGRWGGSAERVPFRLVDLPGYGYARVSQVERLGWGPLVEGYVERRDSLKLVLVLLDARREVGTDEQQMIEWLASVSAPHILVLTKVDKLKASARGQTRDRVRRELGKAAPPVLLTSGQTGEGIPDLWAAMTRALHSPPPAAG